MDLLDRMLGHDRWATEQLLDLSRDLTDAQLDQEFDIGHRTLRETFDHMIFVIDFWSKQMVGQPVKHRSQVTERHAPRSIAELCEHHECFHETFAALARRISDEQRLDDTFVDHFGYPQSLGATILQVMHHNAQHRAEVRHILERLGVLEIWDYDPQEWEHATGVIGTKQA